MMLKFAKSGSDLISIFCYKLLEWVAPFNLAHPVASQYGTT